LIETLRVNIRFLLLIKLHVVFVCVQINTFKAYSGFGPLTRSGSVVYKSSKSLSKQAHTGKYCSAHVVQSKT